LICGKISSSSVEKGIPPTAKYIIEEEKTILHLPSSATLSRSAADSSALALTFYAARSHADTRKSRRYTCKELDTTGRNGRREKSASKKLVELVVSAIGE
jgi:hypothetical protein